MKAISSAANAAYRRWLRVAQAPRAARSTALTLAEGLHLAQAAVDAAVPVEALLVRRGARAPLVAELVERLRGGGASAAECFELAPALYDRLAPVERGAGLMLVVPIAAPALPHGAAADMVYLDGVQDPGNVGAIIRTAAAAGVRHVLAGPGTAALWAPKVVRAGMGAHFRLGLHEQVDAGRLRAALRGDWTAAVAHGAPSLWRCDLSAPAIGWVFGAEGAGPSAAALGACGQRVRIDVSGAVESLNVAAAAAVCLFERRRRLGTAAGA